MADLIQFPEGFGDEDIVAWGTTGLICLDRESKTVIKTAHDDDNRSRIEVERQIYERLQQQGGHRCILQYYGTYGSGLRLELASNWSLSAYLIDHAEVDEQQRLHWTYDVADGLRFVHDAGIIHGDLNLNNVLLTDRLQVKIADFGGSSLDGSDLMVVVHESYRAPGPLLSIDADIFALGSVIYHITTGEMPYHHLFSRKQGADTGRPDVWDHEVKKLIEHLYEQNVFPATHTCGALGNIIDQCWRRQYRKCILVCEDIKSHLRHDSAEPDHTPYTPLSARATSLLLFGTIVIGLVAVVRSRLANR